MVKQGVLFHGISPFSAPHRIQIDDILAPTASGRSRHDQNVFLFKFGWGNPNLYHAKAEVNKVYKVRDAFLSEAQLQELNEGERAHVENAVARNMFLIHLHI